MGKPVIPMRQAGASTSPLERRCRLLMRSYPAEYRRERAEEMVGTLLDTTPPGRTWPLPRDVFALVLGGLQARSARNLRLSTATNLRLAALFGVAIYLSAAAYESLPWGLSPFWSDPWLSFVQGLLIAVTILMAWFASRGVVLIAALAVGAWFYEVPHLLDHSAPAVYVPDAGRALLLAALAALVLLAEGRERPPRLWLCLPAVAIAGPLLALRVPEFLGWFYPILPGLPEIQANLLRLVIVIFLAVLCVDPRPAVALAVYFALFIANQLMIFVFGGFAGPVSVPRLTPGIGAPGVSFAVECLSTAVVLAVLATWRVRRQAVL
jgi:hypothetical protein